jgi:hypothetical protein
MGIHRLACWLHAPISLLGTEVEPQCDTRRELRDSIPGRHTAQHRQSGKEVVHWCSRVLTWVRPLGSVLFSCMHCATYFTHDLAGLCTLYGGAATGPGRVSFKLLQLSYGVPLMGGLLSAEEISVSVRHNTVKWVVMPWVCMVVGRVWLVHTVGPAAQPCSVWG